MKLILRNSALKFEMLKEPTVLAQGVAERESDEPGKFIVINASFVAGKKYYIRNTNAAGSAGVISPDSYTLNSPTVTDTLENVHNESVPPSQEREFQITQNANYLRIYVQYQTGNSVGYQILSYD